MKFVDLFEMANFQTTDSGLPYNIWLDSAGSLRNVEHNYPRLKVELKAGKLVPFSISRNPECLNSGYIKNDGEFRKIKKVYKWIIKNYDVLIMHWNGEISDFEAMKRFERI